MDNKNFCPMRQICQLRFMNLKPWLKLSSQSRTGAALRDSQLGEAKAREGSAHPPSFPLLCWGSLTIGKLRKKPQNTTWEVLPKSPLKGCELKFQKLGKAAFMAVGLTFVLPPFI